MSGILIVDDEPDTATLLRDSLRRRGYFVDEVHSGESCLEYLRTKPVDVVVTDIKMPGMSGIDLIAKLRTDHPELLSIIVTGVANLETAIEAIRVGAYDFIAKPVKADALAIAVGRAMDHLALKHELHALKSAADMPSFDGIVGTSAP